MAHQEAINPGNIHDELIDNLIAQDPFLITTLIEGVVGSTNLHSGDQMPYSVDGRDVKMVDRLVSQGDAKSINGFYSLVNEVIADRLSRENISEKNKLIFTEEYPPTQLRSECITYRLIHRAPATISRGKQLTTGVQDWKGQLRAAIPDPDHPNKKLYIYGQLFDNVIELCCWARTNKAANARALWLERLMSDYAWFFAYNGLSRVRFQERMADQFEVNKTEGNKLHSRPLRYFVRTERLSRLSEYVLVDFLLKARLAAEL